MVVEPNTATLFGGSSFTESDGGNDQPCIRWASLDESTVETPRGKWSAGGGAAVRRRRSRAVGCRPRPRSRCGTAVTIHDRRPRADGAIVSTLVDLVTRAAADVPDQPAVVGAEATLSWAAFADLRDRLAHVIRSAGVAPGDRVTIAIHKSLESVAAFHAVLRAGAIAVPVDPLAPKVAAQRVVDECDPTLNLIDGHTETRFGFARSLRVDALVADLFAAQATPGAPLDGEPLPIRQPGDPAYIIFTSGSTGVPKGIVHTHASGLAYAQRAVATYGVTGSDVIAGMAPLHFDQSTFELFAAPLAGACVVVMDDATMKFPASFVARSAEHDVTIWYSVPFFFRQVLDRGALDRHDLSALRWIKYGGEPFPAQPLADLAAAIPSARFSNVYGPAEVNQCTFHHINRAADGDIEPIPRPDHTEGNIEIPIGRPWEGVEIDIVDGELWVAGPTTMLEYWNDPELTAASCVEHDDPDRPSWYRTGDLVSRDDQGVLWFLGRRDQQVKVRGVRLELEAVESVLSSVPGIQHAVVAPVGPPGDRSHIDAVVVVATGAELDVVAVRRWCAKHLPSVAVPATIHEWSTLPLTGSGKIDRALVRRQLIGDSR